MFRYFIIDKNTSEILQDMAWFDEKYVPKEFTLNENEYVLKVDENLKGTAHDFYNENTAKVITLDITDGEQSKLEMEDELIDLKAKLSDFQEETWKVLGIDETKLSQEWQDLLERKRTLRLNIANLSV